MCTVQTYELHQGVNTNVRFQLQRESAYTVRVLLSTATNWTISDQVRIYSPPEQDHRTLNPRTLHNVAAKDSHPQWSPVNCEPMHTTNTTYTISLQNEPILLTLDAYDSAMIATL